MSADHTMSFVIPFNQEPGTDDYWCDWVALTVVQEGLDSEDEKARKDIEKAINTVNLDDFMDEDDDEDVDGFMVALITAVVGAGFTSTYVRKCHYAFPGGI